MVKLTFEIYLTIASAWIVSSKKFCLFIITFFFSTGHLQPADIVMCTCTVHALSNEEENMGSEKRGWYVGGMCALSSPTLRPVKQTTLFYHPQRAATNHVSGWQKRKKIASSCFSLSWMKLSVTRGFILMDEEKKLLQPTSRALVLNYSAAFGCKLSFEYHLREIQQQWRWQWQWRKCLFIVTVYVLLWECENKLTVGGNRISLHSTETFHVTWGN